MGVLNNAHPKHPLLNRYMDAIISICVGQESFRDLVSFLRDEFWCIHQQQWKLDCFKMEDSWQNIHYSSSFPSSLFMKTCCGYVGFTFDFSAVLSEEFNASLNCNIRIEVPVDYTINITVLHLDWGYYLMHTDINFVVIKNKKYSGLHLPHSQITDSYSTEIILHVDRFSYIRPQQTVSLYFQANDLKISNIVSPQTGDTMLGKCLPLDVFPSIRRGSEMEYSLLVAAEHGTQIKVEITSFGCSPEVSHGVLLMTVFDGPTKTSKELQSHVALPENRTISVTGTTHMVLILVGTATDIKTQSLMMAVKSRPPSIQRIYKMNSGISQVLVSTVTDCHYKDPTLCSFQFTSDTSNDSYMTFTVNNSFGRFYVHESCMYGGLVIQELPHRSSLDTHVMCIDSEITGSTTLHTKSRTIIVSYYSYGSLDGGIAHFDYSVSSSSCYGIGLPCYQEVPKDPNAPIMYLEDSSSNVVATNPDKFYWTNLDDIPATCVIAQFQMFRYRRHFVKETSFERYRRYCFLRLKHEGLWEYATYAIHTMKRPMQNFVMTVHYPYKKQLMFSRRSDRLINRHLSHLSSETLSSFYMIHFLYPDIMELTISVTSSKQLHMASNIYFDNLPAILPELLHNILEQYSAPSRSQYSIKAESGTSMLTMTKPGVSECQEIEIIKSHLCSSQCAIEDDITLITTFKKDPVKLRGMSSSALT